MSQLPAKRGNVQHTGSTNSSKCNHFAVRETIWVMSTPPTTRV